MLNDRLDRRTLLKTLGKTVAATGLASAGLRAFAAESTAPTAKPKILRKSLKLGMVTDKVPMLDKFKLVKEVGFDGLEIDSLDLDQAEVIAARDGSGLPINGVVDGAWQEPFSDPKPEIRKKAAAALEKALRLAKAYGCDSVLLVPGVVNKNSSYDVAYKNSHEGIKQLVPLAKELGVRISLENVWNNFLLSPLEMARFIDEFESPFVRSHFDIGNIVRSGWPEQWIRILGKRIYRLDLKEFSRKKMETEGLWKGFEVEIGDGDNDWPAVMQALREIGYTGWACAEVKGGGRERLADISQRMDRVFAM
jgi:L-ribulose-5-phosphate 3-epimerase